MALHFLDRTFHIINAGVELFGAQGYDYQDPNESSGCRKLKKNIDHLVRFGQRRRGLGDRWTSRR